MCRKSAKISRLIWVAFLILAFVLIVQAQEHSDVDTIRVVDCSGRPGDTVEIPVSLVNTFSVSGISFRIVYDPSVLIMIRVDTAGTRVAGIYNNFGEQIDSLGGWIYWFGTNWVPSANYVSPGSGVIAYLICVVHPQASIGSESAIEFVDSLSAGYITALSDPEGYMVIPIKDGGNFIVTSLRVEDSEISSQNPPGFSLGQVFPNPISNETTIKYACPEKSELNRMTIKIYDAAGQMVKTLFDGRAKPGFHSLKWDGRSDRGPKLPGGVYFCRMDVANGPYGLVRKLILLK